MASIPSASAPKEAFAGHLLVNPLTSENNNLLMLLLCFKNGSLVRESKLLYFFFVFTFSQSFVEHILLFLIVKIVQIFKSGRNMKMGKFYSIIYRQTLN